MVSKKQPHSKDKGSTEKRSPQPAIENADVVAQQQPHPAIVNQKARLAPSLLTPREVLQLQRTVGNQAASRLLAQAAQHQPMQKKENDTGLPDNLRDGVETLSGLSMDDVKVHYNSPKPAQLQALAYTQGTDIYVSPGQERHLPHEAWHVVQQKQGRVEPTIQTAGAQINDNRELEKEASISGDKALNMYAQGSRAPSQRQPTQLLQAKLTVDPVGDCYEQQADRVADQVLRMPLPVSEPRAALSGYPPGSPVSGKAGGTGECIQRKILIEKKKSWDFFTKLFSCFTNLFSKKKAPDLRSKVIEDKRDLRSKMIKDERYRYFESEDEVSRYIKGETENIGYVQKGNTWIRIDDNELLVLGESHEEADVNLQDIVKAVGTNRFMHEGFVECPDQENEALSQAIRKRCHSYEDSFNIKDKKQLKYTKDTEHFSIKDDKAFPHTGESFYTRLLRTLKNIDEQIKPQNPKDPSYTFGFSKFELDLRRAILDAAGTEGTNDQEILQTYYANQEIFDETAKELGAKTPLNKTQLAQKIKSKKSYDLWKGFYQEFMEYAKKKAKQEREDLGDREKKRLEKWGKWNPEFIGPNDKLLKEVEEIRDISMYHHIKTAQKKGYLLYGCGDFHRQRLADILDQEGIRHQSMEDFIKTQKGRHPPSDRECTAKVYKDCSDTKDKIFEKFEKKGWEIKVSPGLWGGSDTYDVVKSGGTEKMTQEDIRKFLKKHCNYKETKAWTLAI